MTRSVPGTPRGIAFAALLLYAGAMPVVAGSIGLWLLPEITDAFPPSLGSGAIFTVAAAVVVAVGLMPATAVAALAGALFGMAGVLPAVTAYVLASVALFEVVRRSLRPGVQAAIAASPRARAVQADLEQATFRIVVLSRLSPALPFLLVSLLLGMSPVVRSTYVAGTLVGMLPRTTGAVAVGAAAERALAAAASGGLLATVLPLVAVLATLGLLWYAGKALRRALGGTAER